MLGGSVSGLWIKIKVKDATLNLKNLRGIKALPLAKNIVFRGYACGGLVIGAFPVIFSFNLLYCRYLKASS